MLSSKYHIGSIIAIFVALGIGILLGGTLGQQWMRQTEQSMMSMLMEKYDRQITENQRMQKQIMSLQLMNKTVNPLLDHKRVMWVRPTGSENAIFSMLMSVAGADLYEIDSALFSTLAGSSVQGKDGMPPDLIVISDPTAASQISAEDGMESLSAEGSLPKVIDVSGRTEALREPKDAVDFILYLKKILEEQTHATVSFYHYSGLE